MLCRRCETQQPLIRAHVIPPSFFRALGRLTQRRRHDLHDAEYPRTVAAMPGWIAQQADPVLHLLWSRLAGLAAVADQAADALIHARAAEAWLADMLAVLTQPSTPTADFPALKAREQAVIDADAVRPALTALREAITDTEIVSPLFVDYVKDAIMVALLADREIKQVRLVSSMKAARQQIAAVVAAQDEHEPLRRWAAGHGAVLALVPLTEPWAGWDGSIPAASA
jgi:hypothetical protein